MLKSITNIAKLLRIRQYYKNFLIFLGIFFSQNLFNFKFILPLIVGFILLCLTSSINYIINDINDIESDKEHPEKLKKKPLASGELSVRFALFLLVLLIITIGLLLTFIIPNLYFTLLLLMIIITGQLYNYIFKHLAFVDILILSTGYLFRALSGCVIIGQFVSAWLFLSIFEVALFLVIAKRKGDLAFLGEKEEAVKHKKVYNKYSQKLLDQFHIIIAGSIFMTYSLYLILKFNLDNPEVVNTNEYLSVISIPIILYILMRYMYLTAAKPEIARRTEKALFDKGILIAGFILGIILIYSFYYEEIFNIFRLFFNLFI